ncbi:MAG: hypothetical protein DRJ03_19465 [Chloroflexi bacterium]|nr:MAG: hypothetical protein DRJ03_19465 [Chloroflexota bacterium]RLI53727.1 MAG: hypothetical protein DRP09_14985 [Candidatus Thorarchaeota archaeon]
MSDEYTPTLPPESEGWDSSTTPEDERKYPQLGEKLLGRYEIFGVKEGGFGIVYFVTDLEADQDYAVKTYKPEFATSLPSIDQFKVEAAFWVNLESHPNIVKAHFVEVIEDQPYLFMEYITGGSKTSLRDWLRAGRIGVDQAVDFAYQLCLGMEFANSKREIAHCDLKPENILIDREGILKVSDFGLVQRVEVQQGKYPTVDSGTWAYAAPEHFTGQAVNNQSDIYSFGIIFYEMLSGRLPYPFKLNQDPKTQYKQLLDFHTSKGANDLSREIYYTGVAGVHGVGRIISGCIEYYTGNRDRDFRMLRERLEYEFKLRPRSYLNRDDSTKEDLYQRALSLHRVGRYSEALSIFNRLLQQRPDEGQLWLDTAKTQLAIGQKSSANKLLKRAIHLDPTLEEAHSLLNS